MPTVFAPLLVHAVFAAALVCATFIAVASAGPRVYLYNEDASPFHTFLIDETQRCYSMPCTNDSLREVKWTYMPSDTWLLLFEGDECTGRSRRQIANNEGSFDPVEEDLKTVKSIVLWKSGMYSTNGVVDACQQPFPDSL